MTNEYEEYAILSAEIEAKKAVLEEKKAKIIEDMIARGEKNADTAVGKFTVAELKNWTYSDKVQKFEAKIKEQVKELTEEVKAKKAKEEEDEIATCEIKPSLRFTPIKL